MCSRGGDRRLVPSISMTRDSDARIIRENALESKPHLGRAIRDDHLTRVQRIPDADAAAVMERHP